MCRIMTFYDTKFRMCEGKTWRFHNRYKKWTRCDDNRQNSEGYIQLGLTNKEGKTRMFYLNRLVYKAYNQNWNIDDNTTNNVIDHKDGDKLNNHNDNLRVLPQQKNQWNRVNAKGCSYEKQKKKWRAYIVLNKKLINLGHYNSEEEAHTVYLKIKKYIHNIENKQYDKLTTQDLDYLSTDKMKNKLLNMINSF